MSSSSAMMQPMDHMSTFGKSEKERSGEKGRMEGGGGGEETVKSREKQRQSSSQRCEVRKHPMARESTEGIRRQKEWCIRSLFPAQSETFKIITYR